MAQNKSLLKIPNIDVVYSNNKIALKIPTKAGIYALWINGISRYIGEAKNLRNRLKQHLFGPVSNNCQYSKISFAANENMTIEISFVEITPEPMCFAIEDGLINRITKIKTKAALPWNKQSVSRKYLEQWVLDYLKNRKPFFQTNAAW